MASSSSHAKEHEADYPLLPTEERNQDQKSQPDKPFRTAAAKRNAFSELMIPKAKRQKTDPTPTTSPQPANTKHLPTAALFNAKNDFRSGLLPYITNPASFPTGTILRQTEHTILIRDLYPKALVHLLLLPRNPAFYNQTPVEAFQPTTPDNTAFLALIRSEASSAALLAASELSRLISPYSASCKARNDALDNDEPPDALPPGRDFLPDIRVGIHAQPSMDTLHVHIVSVDNRSECLKHKKHYNSFNSPFFVPLEDFPLSEDDERLRKERQEAMIKGDMRCWRCQKNYGNKLKVLKEHLEEEYRTWRRI